MTDIKISADANANNSGVLRKSSGGFSSPTATRRRHPASSSRKGSGKSVIGRAEPSSALSRTSSVASSANETPVLPDDLPASVRAQIVNAHDFNEIPVIDLAAVERAVGIDTSQPQQGWGQREGQIEELLERVRVAAEEVGFMIIEEHGVEQETTESMFSKAREFFMGCSTEQKLRYKQDGTILAGYFGKGMENLEDVRGDDIPSDSPAIPEDSDTPAQDSDAVDTMDLSLTQRSKDTNISMASRSSAKVDVKEGFDMSTNMQGDAGEAIPSAPAPAGVDEREPSESPSARRKNGERDGG